MSNFINTLEQENEQPNTQPNAQADEVAHEHIITKLDLYFNYIINNNSQLEFENMSVAEKETIISTLKRLDLYIDNPKILDWMSEEQKSDYKMQYWLIHELYFSPYKMFLNTITRKQFLFRYLKTKKYADLNHMSSAKKFIKYFMRCIQEEMEATNKIYDRKSERKGEDTKC